MGLLDYVEPTHKAPSTKSLLGKATILLKEKKRRKKTRRGKGSKKKATKQAQHEKDMAQYRKQKRARGEMFKEFERLIGE